MPNDETPKLPSRPVASKLDQKAYRLLLAEQLRLQRILLEIEILSQPGGKIEETPILKAVRRPYRETPRLLTVEENSALLVEGGPTELVRGRIVEVPTTYPFYGFVCTNIARRVGNHVDAQKLGRVVTNDSGIITERDPDTLRGADVCFYSFNRLPPGPFARDQYLAVMPELVFEVRSPSDGRSLVLGKVAEYLTAGVSVVCAVNPESGTAVVYRDNQDPETFPAESELTLPDVLPGFRVPLRQFFE